LLAALTQAFGIDDALGGIRKSRAETISVSADPSFATCWLAPHLSMFYAITLNADVVLNADMRLVDFGNDGTILAIRYAKERSNWPRTEARKLYDVRLSAYLSPALTESVDLNAPSDLLSLPRLNEDSRDDWRLWFDAAGAAPPIAERGAMFNDSAVMLQAAISGQGAASIDELFAVNALARGELIRPFDIFIPGGSYWLVSRSFANLTDGARAFADWLVESVRTENLEITPNGSN
jgi:LysR family transcriptional regulator, glycine cleavage system transcriptional activator